MGKWIALSLVIIGAAMVLHALRQNRTASFDDGSFLYMIGELLLGAAAIVLGAVIFIILLFARL